MNPEQRNQANNQTDNGGNEKSVSSSRGGAVDKDKQSGTGVGQQRDSNDLAGGMPKSPGGNRQSADEKMDDDTGLSNTVNRQAPVDQGSKQAEQSNVGRRDDGTPD